MARNKRKKSTINQEQENGTPKKFRSDSTCIEEKTDGKIDNSSHEIGILTDITFDMMSDKLSTGTLQAIREMGYSNLTEIQAKTIPHLLLKRDVNGAAKTGSGKTLAFLIPAIELLVNYEFEKCHGTGCIVLSPTRELALQSSEVLSNLSKHHNITHGLVIGGRNMKTEAERLKSGLNIIVATPGRLLDHMKNTKDFNFRYLKMLIIDEADRLLDMGFERQMKKIISMLPQKRQTVLFSATPTTKTQDLARISLKGNPIYIGVDDAKVSATVSGLQQSYVFFSPDKKFLTLFSILKMNRHEKIMVFFKTCRCVAFYDVVLNQIGIPVKSIHGKMRQNARTSVFNNFIKAQNEILLCTDVAARGLDIPNVDWIIQYDPPENHKEYIHRVGRTARGVGNTGKALIFLLHAEKEFLTILKQSKIEVEELKFSFDKVIDISPQIIKIVAKRRELHKMAIKAYKCYIKGYKSSNLKHIFDIKNIDLHKTATSFGLSSPPVTK